MSVLMHPALSSPQVITLLPASLSELPDVVSLMLYPMISRRRYFEIWAKELSVLVTNTLRFSDAMPVPEQTGSEPKPDVVENWVKIIEKRWWIVPAVVLAFWAIAYGQASARVVEAYWM